ncbi:uncharacterized protein LOC130678513 [Microplitis mediator]|uniref:uncharacterized protein LOC130678513 n=1 Tax=Microplitis mediator TaxID=375433 RepID=UPI0025562D90|nr:uncharacterized protein LOC130678513 [Microplitis mediator]
MLNMENYNADKLFYIVNLNVNSVVQSGIEEIEKLAGKLNSNENYKFLRYVKSFIDYGLSRLGLSVTDDRTRQSHYCKLWHHVNKLQDKYKSLSDKLFYQRKLHREVESKLMSEYLKNIKTLKEFNDKYINDAELISNKYERLQVNEYQQSLARQNDLNQICGFTKNKTDALMATNKKLEMDIYSKRIKVISQLTSLLHRYDTEIGDKKCHLEKLKAERCDLEENLKQTEEIINKQSIIYEEYMNERHKSDIDRLESFRKNRAAKKIQLWWRFILTVKKKKTKTKGQKKKKKKIKKRRRILP